MHALMLAGSNCSYLQALHLTAPNGHALTPGRSSFTYNISGPYSISLYPELVDKIRILIYNGDSDPSVPFQGAWTPL